MLGTALNGSTGRLLVAEISVSLEHVKEKEGMIRRGYTSGCGRGM